MKGLLKGVIATSALIIANTGAFAADVNTTANSSSLNGATVVGFVALFLVLIVAPAARPNKTVK